MPILAKTWPRRFYSIEDQQILEITLLGYDDEISWKLTDKGLVIDFPSEANHQPAYVFKIETDLGQFRD